MVRNNTRGWTATYFRYLVVAAASLAGPLAGIADEPKFTFVKSSATKKHIAVQPRDDYHRIYFLLRVEHCAGKTAFAQVRCRPSKGESETLQSVTLEVKDKNELWRVYFRAPKHANITATYQAEVGYRDISELDPDQVCNAYGWEVQREQGRFKFVTETAGPMGAVSAIVLPIPARASVIEGGKIKIVTQVKYAAATPVKDLLFGLDEGESARASFDGNGATRVAE